MWGRIFDLHLKNDLKKVNSRNISFVCENSEQMKNNLGSSCNKNFATASSRYKLLILISKVYFISSQVFLDSKWQEKIALRMLSFSDLGEPSSPLFIKLKILKINDIVEIQNCPFVHSFSKRKLLESFENIFQKCNTVILWLSALLE